MDIPRQHTIREAHHRIIDPFTDEKLALLGRSLRLAPGTTVLDLACGTGEMLSTWARDHGIVGTGVDLSSVFVARARERAAALGVDVTFLNADASDYVASPPVDVAACVGASWIGGGVVGTLDLLERSLNTVGSSCSGNRSGARIRRPTRPYGAAAHRPRSCSARCPGSWRSSARPAGTWSRWCLPTRTAGTGTSRRSG